jgi:hypothetical protein
MNKQVAPDELDLKTSVPGGEIPEIGIEQHGDNTAQEQLGATGSDRPPPATAPKCENCGKGFEPRKGGRAQRFCSPECRLAFHAEQRETDKATIVAFKQRATLPAVTPDLPEPKTSPAPTGEDFDWLNDNSVVLREQPETAVYFNRDGALVIRQRAAWNQEDDPFVFISPANIGEFLDKLTEACGVPLAGRQ